MPRLGLQLPGGRGQLGVIRGRSASQACGQANLQHVDTAAQPTQHAPRRHGRGQMQLPGLNVHHASARGPALGAAAAADTHRLSMPRVRGLDQNSLSLTWGTWTAYAAHQPKLRQNTAAPSTLHVGAHGRMYMDGMGWGGDGLGTEGCVWLEEATDTMCVRSAGQGLHPWSRVLLTGRATHRPSVPVHSLRR